MYVYLQLLENSLTKLRLDVPIIPIMLTENVTKISHMCGGSSYFVSSFSDSRGAAEEERPAQNSILSTVKTMLISVMLREEKSSELEVARGVRCIYQ